jgi:hypothetical protein
MGKYRDIQSENSNFHDQACFSHDFAVFGRSRSKYGEVDQSTRGSGPIISGTPLTNIQLRVQCNFNYVINFDIQDSVCTYGKYQEIPFSNSKLHD